MRKINCLLIFAMFLLQTLSAQDKIITQNKDTIDCKITAIDGDSLTFEIVTKGITTTGTYSQKQIDAVHFSTESLGNIRQFNQMKPADRSLAEKSYNEKALYQENNDKSKFSVQLQSGYGSLLASSTEAMHQLIVLGFDYDPARRYYQELRSTLVNSIALQYQLFTIRGYQLSMGISYQNMFNHSLAESAQINVDDGIHKVNGTFEEKIYTNYYAYGLRHTFTMGAKRKSAISLEAGTGLVSYRNQLILAHSPVLIQGLAPAYYSQLAYAFRITPALSLDVTGGLFAAVLKNLKVSTPYSSQRSELSSDQYESLSRAYVKAGLTYHF
ncbi:hypothetical protein [Roseimarinus sediminis]|uniref:hypothetical protein n=1 Tax=Roseimarinus sediminis TaxID=1610899 RepID=UPI003D1F4452